MHKKENHLTFLCMRFVKLLLQNVLELLIKYKQSIYLFKNNLQKHG